MAHVVDVTALFQSIEYVYFGALAGDYVDEASYSNLDSIEDLGWIIHEEDSIFAHSHSECEGTDNLTSASSCQLIFACYLGVRNSFNLC